MTDEQRNLFWLHLKITIGSYDDPAILTEIGEEFLKAIMRVRNKYPYPRLTFEDLMIVPDALTQPIFLAPVEEVQE